MNGKIYAEITKNKSVFDKRFENSADYFFKYISISGVQCALVMCEDLVDLLKLWEVYLKPLDCVKDKKDRQEVVSYIKNNTTIPFNPSGADNFEQAMFFLTAGFALILIDGINEAMVMPVQGYPTRGVEKPSAEGNLRGTKESFTDAGRKNMGLIRRRIRSENLVVTTLQIGSKTKTEVSLYYHSDYCPKKLAQTVKERLENIDLPVILESGYLTPFVDTTSYSLFQSVGYTERPDTFCAKLCEGKIGIIVDGTPHAIIYPIFFEDNFLTNDDYSQRPYYVTLIRMIRYFAFFIATVLPGLYVALTTYAPQAINEKMIFYAYSSRKATPLPLFAEAVMIIILFEIIKEAGLRLPAPIGSSVSIVSALIIGDAVIKAGLIGSAILIICSVSTIAAFIIPSFYEPITILRIIFVLCSGIFGLPGVTFAFIFMIINIINVNSADYNYSTIIDNTHIKPAADGIFKTSWRKLENKNYDLNGVKNGK